MTKKIDGTETTAKVIGGIDTHQDLHTAAVVSTQEEILGVKNFSTTRAGYRAMLAWFRSHGDHLRVGVEATGSYGAGITCHLALAGVPVLEVTGPDVVTRRGYGKDDSIDAISAGRAALTGQRTSVAKDRSGAVEALKSASDDRQDGRTLPTRHVAADPQHHCGLPRGSPGPRAPHDPRSGPYAAEPHQKAVEGVNRDCFGHRSSSECD